VIHLPPWRAPLANSRGALGPTIISAQFDVVVCRADGRRIERSVAMSPRGASGPVEPNPRRRVGADSLARIDALVCRTMVAPRNYR
jgi:hypothetical protein